MMTDDIYTIGKAMDLKREMKRTIETPPLPVSGRLRHLLENVDGVCGKARTLPKFMVLEMLARYPHWAQEHGSVAALTRLYGRAQPPSQEQLEAAVRQIQAGVAAQDREPWPMLLWADLCQQRGVKLSLLKHALMPNLLTFAFSCLTRRAHKSKPVQAAEMKAAFASYLEHEYMLFSREHPEYEAVPVESVWFAHYPRQKTLADLIRRVGLDERDAMNHALEEVRRLAASVCP